MKLQISLTDAGSADGVYRVTAKGCLLTALFWADGAGALEAYSAFAYVPLASNGTGSFSYGGRRAIPREATHVLARAVRTDMRGTDEVLEALPYAGAERRQPPERRLRLAVLTDTHLSNQAWSLRRALRLAGDADAVLCAGDLTNDGLPEQFALLRETLAELPPTVPFFPVCGNHDYPVRPLPLIPEGVNDYPGFQTGLLRRAAALGFPVEADRSGAYGVLLGGVDLVGLNAATHCRRFRFAGGAQLSWLARRLEAVRADWHLVLCHAPLYAHNPQRSEKNTQTYLHQDKRLQAIIDGGENIIFLSGHTHLSFNCMKGCVETDAARGNLYVNCGSVRPTALRAEEPVQPKEYTDGNIVFLELSDRWAEVTAVSVRDGAKIARGLYRVSRRDTE